MIWMQQDLAKEALSSRAQMDLQVALAVLQWTVQRIDCEPQILAIEHNELVALYRNLGELMASPLEAAERIRTRGKDLGNRAELPTPIPTEQLSSAYHELSDALIDTLNDVDELLRERDASAEAALNMMRKHLHTRTMREFEKLIVNPNAMPGRQ